MYVHAGTKYVLEVYCRYTCIHNHTYTALSLSISRSGVTVRSRPVYIALLRPLKKCQQKQGGKLPKPALGDGSPWYHVEGPPRDGQHWFTRWSWQEAIAACQGWANLG